MLLLVEEKLKWQCKEGHIWEATLYYIKKKIWKPEFFKIFLGSGFQCQLYPPASAFLIYFFHK
jgi:hypothetical protein